MNRSGRRVLLLVGLAFACSLEPPGPPNVLLITIDTARADHFSVYGYSRDTTPVLRKFATEGVRFDAAYAPTATTAPTHASIFTGLYPPTHRVLMNGIYLDDAHETLAETLGLAGWASGAVVSSYVLHPKFNYGQGFENWDADFSQANVPDGVTAWEGDRVEGKFYGRADDTTRRAISWLKSLAGAGRPFFLFVHYYDPHDPYQPPSEFAKRLPPLSDRAMDQTISRYDAELAFTDAEIGRLLETLDDLELSENTLVVVAGDHGEGLMTHGHMNHGVQIYEEAVRVPLLIRWPNRIPGEKVVAEPMEIIDIAPTIADLAGVAVVPQAYAGRSLASRLLGEERHIDERPIWLYRRTYQGSMVSRTWAKGEQFGIREGRWKYILGPSEGTEELFDLVADPGEKNNVRGQHPEVATRLAAKVEVWRREHTREDPEEVGVTPEDRRRLKALGYAD